MHDACHSVVRHDVSSDFQFFCFFFHLRALLYLFLAILSSGTRRPYASITLYQIYGKRKFTHVNVVEENEIDIWSGKRRTHRCKLQSMVCEWFLRTFHVSHFLDEDRGDEQFPSRWVSWMRIKNDNKVKDNHFMQNVRTRCATRQPRNDTPACFGVWPMCVIYPHPVNEMCFVYAFSMCKRENIKNDAAHPSSRIDVICLCECEVNAYFDSTFQITQHQLHNVHDGIVWWFLRIFLFRPRHKVCRAWI